MKYNLFYFLLISYLLFSCSKEKTLQGSWISAYKYESRDSLKKPMTGLSFNQVWTFNSNNLRIKEFKYDWFQEPQSLEYKIKRNKLVINERLPDFAPVIDPITKDSFQLSSLSYAGVKHIYKKVHDSLKTKSSTINFVGKRYVRKYKTYTDTIHFLNDSVLRSSAWKQGNRSNLFWEKVTINGFNILFTETHPPFVIKKKIGDKIHISTFDTKKEDYYMIRIDEDTYKL